MYDSRYCAINFQAPVEQRMLFISLHDKGTEGEYKYDMRWLQGSDVTFTAPVNQTYPTSALSQLVARGQFQDIVTVWNPSNTGSSIIIHD